MPRCHGKQWHHDSIRCILKNISGIMCLPLAIFTIVFKNEISLDVISALRQEDLKFKAAFILSQTAKTKQTNQTVFQCRRISEHKKVNQNVHALKVIRECMGVLASQGFLTSSVAQLYIASIPSMTHGLMASGVLTPLYPFFSPHQLWLYARKRHRSQLLASYGERVRPSCKEV